MSRGMSNALSVAGSAVGGVEKSHDIVTSKGKFLSAGSKELMSASVTDSAGQASAMSKKAPDVAITMASAGGKLAAQAGVAAVKAVLTATGVGAGVAVAIDTAQTIITKVADKAMEKMQSGMEQGNSVMQQGSSTASFSNTLQAMKQDQTKMESPIQDVKQAAGEVKDAAMTGVSVAKGAAGGSSGAPGAESGSPDIGSQGGLTADNSVGLPEGASEVANGPVGLVVTPGLMGSDPVGAPVIGDTQGPSELDSSLLPEVTADAQIPAIRAETEAAVKDAMGTVPHDLANPEASSAQTKTLGSQALDAEFIRNGFDPEIVKEQAIESAVSKADPATADSFRAFLAKEMSDPTSQIHTRLYTERAGDLMAENLTARAIIDKVAKAAKEGPQQ